jgi:hypothetical protein
MTQDLRSVKQEISGYRYECLTLLHAIAKLAASWLRVNINGSDGSARLKTCPCVP